MTGFLQRMADRAAGGERRLRVRPTSRFESTAALVPPLQILGRAGTPFPGGEPEELVAAPLEVEGRGQEHPLVRPSPVHAVPPPAAAPTGSSFSVRTRPVPAGPAARATQLGVKAAVPVTSVPAATRAGRPPQVGGDQQPGVAGPSRQSRPADAEVADVSEARSGRAASSEVPPAGWQVRRPVEEPHSPGLPLIGDPDEEPTEVRPTLTPPAAQADNAGVTPAVPADLLEEHVLPALVARGLVSSAAQIEWEDEGANPDAQLMTPGDGLADRRPVRVTGRRGTAGRAVERTTPTPTGTRVEVTIDRIEIITQPAPPPPPPVGAVPRRPQVDHADYRARRRQGRS